jgi:phosphatidylglycerophosphate synthase
VYASKGPVVEEWADRVFFGPAGWRIATALMPTRVSPDAVTFASLVLGVVAGHLLWYTNAWINLAGVGLFIWSDILDSADGQLARLRGTSTRLGRILDGLADSARFLSLYLHLAARLYMTGWGWSGIALGLGGLFSHAYQAAAVDFIRHAYLYFAVGKGSELEVGSEDYSGIAGWLYRDYLRRQSWLFPRTTELARTFAGRTIPEGLSRTWAERQRWVVAGCAWIAQNIRWLLLAVTVVPGWPAAYCWIVVGPLNAVLIFLIIAHEREPRLCIAAY